MRFRRVEPVRHWLSKPAWTKSGTGRKLKLPGWRKQWTDLTGFPNGFGVSTNERRFRVRSWREFLRLGVSRLWSSCRNDSSPWGPWQHNRQDASELILEDALKIPRRFIGRRLSSQLASNLTGIPWAAKNLWPSPRVNSQKWKRRAASTASARPASSTSAMCSSL